MIWASMGVFGAITSAVNHAWGVEKQPSYLKHKLISFIMLVAASLLLLAGLLLVSAINVAEARWFAVVARRTRRSSPCCTTSRCGGRSTVVFIPVVGLIFYFVPNAKVRFRDVWVGAVVTGLLWRGALSGFSWYVRDLTRFSHVHGSIAAVVVFLVWIYIVGGAAAVRRRSDRRQRAAAAPPAGRDSRRAVARESDRRTASRLLAGAV